jgi:hypothetical protein
MSQRILVYMAKETTVGFLRFKYLFGCTSIGSSTELEVLVALIMTVYTGLLYRKAPGNGTAAMSHVPWGHHS